MNKLIAWARESKDVLAFLFIVAVISFWLVSSNVAQTATAERQRTIIAALARENFDAIQANGNFQTCVWRGIVKPDVLGHEQRAARVIRACDRRYLKEVGA